MLNFKVHAATIYNFTSTFSAARRMEITLKNSTVINCESTWFRGETLP